MYREYFHLSRTPFELSPDPSFLFGTPKHNEALASLYYGIRRRKGFVVLTGEVGTGKTLMIRCLLRMLPPSQAETVYLFNPLLTPMQFLQYILADLSLPVRGNKHDILRELNAHLIDRNRRGITPVLIVDEAHHLSSEVLEEIRLLTNLEGEQKLLQIVLAGQPELDEKLDSPELRQLKQRIALRCWLEPLTPDETSAYIQRRLEVAACPNANALFPAEAVQAIYRYSQGVPRLINTICENSLISAFAHQTPSVSVNIVEDVVKDLRLTVVTHPQECRDASTQQVLVDTLLRLLENTRSDTGSLLHKGNSRERLV